MIGAFIGDLAAWTWRNEQGKFYPQLFLDVSQKSVYSDVMIFTAKTLLRNPDISRDEFMRMHQCYFGLGNAIVNAEYDVLRSIIIGWIYDEDLEAHTKKMSNFTLLIFFVSYNHYPFLSTIFLMKSIIRGLG